MSVLTFILHPCAFILNVMPKSTRNIGLSELRVGLLVLIAIAVLILLILNASGTLNPFASHIHLRARFSDANGLREGSEVRLAGVRIGKVDRIRLLNPSEVGSGPNPQKVEAFMTIDSKIDGVPAQDRIRSDSTAQQMAPSILGSEMIVNITPGTSLGQQIKENDLLTSTSGSTISDLATNGTELAQKLSKLSDQLNEVVKNVREGKGTVGRLFNDEALYNNLNATIRDAEELANQIKSGKGSAG
ncbi:MAG: phospholipid/cholesterol/gamma-HCH transport system substrate-binding protein, partial [Blastocatellia bacterium]|nr:phospholipid/cholesterol/gamma-HCH transport system substrate-binding protein [Blastocatellia bacterium]